MHACVDLNLNRRRFLKLGAMAGLAAALPAKSWASTLSSRASSVNSDRHLRFYHTHTGESLDTMYCCRGEYVPDALKSINHFLRDFRANEVKAIDTRLLDLLHRLFGELGAPQPLHIISAYRTAATNAMLQARNGDHSGVATHSLHIQGMAADVRLPGVALTTLRDAAKSLRIGGVGYYPASDFVHVDVGRVRYW